MANRGSEPEMEEKSWCLFSTLLRIGHAVDFRHLASRCPFFTATPELVLHLASLPDSPLAVTGDGLVTPSAVAVYALGRFFSVQFQQHHHPCRKRKLFLDSNEGNALFSFFRKFSVYLFTVDSRFWWKQVEEIGRGWQLVMEFEKFALRYSFSNFLFGF